MPSTITDRLYGLTTSVAVKAPCRVVATSNITLSGLQTIDGEALAAGDRVLCVDQNTGSDNGIWLAQTGTWTRPGDWDGSLDAVTGTKVLVVDGTAHAWSDWVCTTTGSIVVGTTSVSFAQTDIGNGVTPLDYGAVGDGVADDTAAIQAAFDALEAGTIGALYFPDGTYKVTAAITANAAVMYGWHVYGQSRAKTILKQFTNNVPLFQFTVDNMHTVTFEHMTLGHNTSQAAHTSGHIFDFLSGGGARSVYRCSWRDLFLVNSHCAFHGSPALFWGNSVTDFFASGISQMADIAGSPVAGQPHNVWHGGINADPAGPAVYMFNCAAVDNEYSVEILNSKGLAINDGAGGQHTLTYLSCEVVNFDSGTSIIVNCPSSTVTVTGNILFKSMSMPASARVYGFQTSGAAGEISGENIHWDFGTAGIAAQGASSRFAVFRGGDANMKGRMNFRSVDGVFTAGNVTPASELFDFGGSVTGAYCQVDDWCDPRRIKLLGDADFTMTFDGPGLIVSGVARTATRKIIMPYSGTGAGNNMFDGWGPEVWVQPEAVGGFDIQVRNSTDTATLLTIPAATVSGRYRIRFDRASLVGSGGVGHWSFAYLGPSTPTPLASTTEALTGTDTSKFVTPDALAALWEQGSDVASAGTLSLGEGGYFNITGTTTITDIDFATDKAGRRAWLKFAGALTLTNGASLILPTGANIVTAAGDTAEFVSEGSDVVRCVSYTRATGEVLVFGYATGNGGTVTQITSRTTGVTLNKPSGQITLVSAAGSAVYASFTVTNSTVGVNDNVYVSQKSGTDLYEIHVTAVSAGSFRITYRTTGGTTVEQPVFTFTVIKGAAS